MARIVFFGNERLATGLTTSAPTLQALVAGGHDVAAIVSHQSTGGASQKSRKLEIAEVAAEHAIPLLMPEKPSDILEELHAMRADIGVLVAYGKIVPQSVIDIFPHGIVNIHPSLLPLHRGPIPIESAILEGARETGVSIMQLVRSMDAGPVYGQHRHALRGDESKKELADTLLAAGGELLTELLPGIIDGRVVPGAQDDDAATYDELITKAEGILDFNKPADRLEREVRAYLGWPGSRTSVGGKDVVVTAAHVNQLGEPDGFDTVTKPGSVWRDGKQFGFHTSDGILVLDKLKPAGKGEMTAEAFLAGYTL